MSLVMKENKAADPVEIGLFGADGIVEHPHLVSNLIEQSGWGLAEGGRVHIQFLCSLPAAKLG